ncbi:hypothetical protein AAC387_Pa05g0347 [Persea americana]
METFRSGETATPEIETDPSFVLRHKKTPSSDRLLGLFFQSPSISIIGSELQENDRIAALFLRQWFAAVAR